MQIYFYKQGEIIANSYYVTSDSISEWTALEIPLSYETEVLPDSATIYFVTGAYVQHSESMLYIDNLSFTGFVNELKAPGRQSGQVLFFYHPASDIIVLEHSNQENLILNIYSLAGALVKSETIKPTQNQINVGGLNEGLYLLECTSKERTDIHKLIIKR